MYGNWSTGPGSMLVIKVELWPHGEQMHAKEIARLNIANDGTGGRDFADYKGWEGPSNDGYLPTDKEARKSSVYSYPRALPVWNLVARMLAAMSYK